MKIFSSCVLLIMLCFGCADEERIRADIERKYLEKQKIEQEKQKFKETLHERETELFQKDLEIESQRQELELLKNKVERIPRKLEDLYKEVQNSVYVVYAKSNEGVSQGSAFVVSPDGIAISNYHVFKDASEYIAINNSGDRLLINEIIDYSKQKDYIIFRIGPLERKIPFLQLSNSLPSIGEECFTVGNPKGLRQTLSKGIISSFRENKNLIQNTTQITYGSSGGPLFNSNGEVIGITTSGVGAADLNFAVNISEVPINRYLNNSNETINYRQNYNHRDGKDLVDKYYRTIENNNFEILSNMYADHLNRYYNTFSISKYEAVQKAKSHKSSNGILDEQYSIRWNTLDINEFESRVTIKFVLDYKIQKRNKDRSSDYVLAIVIELDTNGLITSIYENLLAKYN